MIIEINISYDDMLKLVESGCSFLGVKEYYEDEESNICSIICDENTAEKLLLAISVLGIKYRTWVRNDY